MFNSTWMIITINPFIIQPFIHPWGRVCLWVRDARINGKWRQPASQKFVLIWHCTSISAVVIKRCHINAWAWLYDSFIDSLTQMRRWNSNDTLLLSSLKPSPQGDQPLSLLNPHNCVCLSVSFSLENLDQWVPQDPWGRPPSRGRLFSFMPQKIKKYRPPQAEIWFHFDCVCVNARVFRPRYTVFPRGDI